jgi:hypothetical protein
VLKVLHAKIVAIHLNGHTLTEIFKYHIMFSYTWRSDLLTLHRGKSWIQYTKFSKHSCLQIPRSMLSFRLPTANYLLEHFSVWKKAFISWLCAKEHVIPHWERLASRARSKMCFQSLGYEYRSSIPTSASEKEREKEIITPIHSSAILTPVLQMAYY